MAQIAEQGVNLIAAEAYQHLLYIRQLFLEPAAALFGFSSLIFLSADEKMSGENGLAPSLLCACDEQVTSQKNVLTPSFRHTESLLDLQTTDDEWALFSKRQQRPTT